MYYQYSNSLLGVIAMIMNHDMELARDVLHESMVKIWNNISSYDSSNGSLFTWMINICRNTAMDNIRSGMFKNQQEIQSVDVYPMPETFLGDIPKPETTGLQKMTEMLDLSHREVVDAVYLPGYTTTEAAEKPGIPLGTLKTRMRKDIIELRKYFDYQQRHRILISL